MSADIRFSSDEASESAIRDHLKLCDEHFMPPLSERVDIGEYAHRLCNAARRFEAWCDGVLVGLVAGYFDHVTNARAFVSSVSVLPGYQNMGLASALMLKSIQHARRLKLRAIALEVGSGNTVALGLYQRLGFVVIGTVGSSLTMELVLNTEDGNGN